MINFNTQPLSQHVKNANIFNNVGLYGIMVAGFMNKPVKQNDIVFSYKPSNIYGSLTSI